MEYNKELNIKYLKSQICFLEFVAGCPQGANCCKKIAQQRIDKLKGILDILQEIEE